MFQIVAGTNHGIDGKKNVRDHNEEAEENVSNDYEVAEEEVSDQAEEEVSNQAEEEVSDKGEEEVSDQNENQDGETGVQGSQIMDDSGGEPFKGFPETSLELGRQESQVVSAVILQVSFISTFYFYFLRLS